MLPQKHRLKSRPDFKRTLASRRLCSNDAFVVYSFKSQGTHALRFGFIVSRKIHKRAVRRNRIKRRYREIIRRDVLPLLSGRDWPADTFVVIARPGSLEASYELLRERLVGCFSKMTGTVK